MKKLIHTTLIATALISGAANASELTEKGTVIQSEPSYACRVMLERGSEMFCPKEKVLAYLQEKNRKLAAMDSVAKAAGPLEATSSTTSKL